MKKQSIKKNTKKALEYLLAVIFAISTLMLSILVIFLFFCIFTIIAASSAFAAADKTPAEKFQEAMQYTNSLKNIVSVEGNNIKVDSFKLAPEKTFSNPKTKESWYTENPKQTGYYDRVDNAQEMGKEAIAETTKDEVYNDANGNPMPTPGKAVINSFRTRPIVKVNQNEAYVKNSNLVIDNALNVVAGTSNKFINCENKKTISCKIKYNEKTCNEEVRTVQRICEKVPIISVTTKEVVFPNCKNIEVKQGHRNFCSWGFRGAGTLLYTDMLEGPCWDDIFLCERTGYSNECYVGYFVQGIYHGNNANNNPSYTQGRGTVPKKMQGYMRFMHTYNGPMPGTIYNETKNTVVEQGSFGGGRIVALPYSATEDQVFRFSLSNSYYVGVVIIYVDHINHEKVANITESGETCHDI